MGIFSKKNKSTVLNLEYVDGINLFKKGLLVEVTLNSEKECITIRPKIGQKTDVNLRFEQITGFDVVKDKDIIEKSKSVAGRAVLGGVLLGPLGAIVGGMTGIGNKQKSVSHNYMVINYKSLEEEIKVIIFEVVGINSNLVNFIEELGPKISKNIIQENQNEIYL